jgi:hypothetical protein
VNGACRSVSDGLPYCSRSMFALSRVQVSLSKVQSKPICVVQAVGSPSFSAGKCAARMGW